MAIMFSIGFPGHLVERTGVRTYAGPLQTVVVRERALRDARSDRLSEYGMLRTLAIL